MHRESRRALFRRTGGLVIAPLSYYVVDHIRALMSPSLLCRVQSQVASNSSAQSPARLHKRVRPDSIEESDVSSSQRLGIRRRH